MIVFGLKFDVEEKMLCMTVPLIEEIEAFSCLPVPLGPGGGGRIPGTSQGTYLREVQFFCWLGLARNWPWL
jgi:hypothetical protein